MIRAIHDVKGIDMGNSLVRYKAEMDFDGRELTRSYLDKQELNELLKVCMNQRSGIGFSHPSGRSRPIVNNCFFNFYFYLQVVKTFQTTDELEQFLLNHGENIVDLMGGEIDRIEMKLRVMYRNLD